MVLCQTSVLELLYADALLVGLLCMSVFFVCFFVNIDLIPE